MNMIWLNQQRSQDKTTIHLHLDWAKRESLHIKNQIQDKEFIRRNDINILILFFKFILIDIK